MKVALVVGHSPTSTGARNSSYDVDEFRLNEELARNIMTHWSDYNMSDDIHLVYRENGLMELPIEINSLDPDLVVSLHFNDFDTHVNGCEMLYYHKSTKGKDIARIFQNKIVQVLENKDRGIKPRSSEDRGGYLLRYTNAPCIICEPFFLDNDVEYLNAKEKWDELVAAYCESLNESFKYLRQSNKIPFDE